MNSGDPSDCRSFFVLFPEICHFPQRYIKFKKIAEKSFFSMENLSLRGILPIVKKDYFKLSGGFLWMLF